MRNSKRSPFLCCALHTRSPFSQTDGSSDWGDPDLVNDVSATRAYIVFYQNPIYLPPREKIMRDLEPAFRNWASSDLPPDFLTREDLQSKLGLLGYTELLEHAKTATKKLEALKEKLKEAEKDEKRSP